MNPMMHPAMSNPGVPRQVKIFNQQDMVRLQQSGLNAQHAPGQPPADMFASSSMQPVQDQMHGSPHPAAQSVGLPGANQGMVPGNQPAAQKRMMTPAEFQERRNYLLSLISQSENNLASLLQNARNAVSVDVHTQQKINQLRGELVSRRDVFTKFVATFGAMLSQQMANGLAPPNMAHMYVLSILRSLIIVHVLVEILWRIPPRSSPSRQLCPTPRSSPALLPRLPNLSRHHISFPQGMAHLRCLPRIKVL